MEYTYSEAIILRDYYLDKLIGKRINDSFDHKVTEINLKQLDNGNYLVTPGFWHNNSDFFWIEINDAVKKFDLVNPIEVLSTHKD
jgi:hypothetical protein